MKPGVVELMPLEKDSIDGVDVIHYSAIVPTHGRRERSRPAKSDEGGTATRLRHLWSTQTAALVRPAPGRSALRKNR